MNIMKIRQEHLEKLQQQFCIDFNCNLEDFKKDKNIVTVWKKNDKRRWYVDYSLGIRAATFYDKILVSVDEHLYEWAKEEFTNCFSGFCVYCTICFFFFVQLSYVFYSLQKPLSSIILSFF